MPAETSRWPGGHPRARWAVVTETNRLSSARPMLLADPSAIRTVGLMSQSEHAPHGRARRVPMRLLTAGVTAVAMVAAAGGGTASAAACAGGNANPNRVSTRTVARTTLCLINGERRGHAL